MVSIDILILLSCIYDCVYLSVFVQRVNDATPCDISSDENITDHSRSKGSRSDAKKKHDGPNSRKSHPSLTHSSEDNDSDESEDVEIKRRSTGTGSRVSKRGADESSSDSDNRSEDDTPNING